MSHRRSTARLLGLAIAACAGLAGAAPATRAESAAAADGSVKQTLFSDQHISAAGTRSRAFTLNQCNKIARLRIQSLRLYFFH